MIAELDFFALEAVLIARLEAQLADLVPAVQVLTSVDLDGVSEAQQHTPAVHLVYQGYNVAESRADGKAARVEQTWLVVVATRNQRSLRSGQEARADAGLIARRVCAALMGFKPTAASKPLALTEAPAAGYSAGFQYVPLGFKAEVVIDPRAT